tara:strand:- start:96 stop:611 length:516 start_codon:yes stop_codon:yes gene_type:complete
MPNQTFTPETLHLFWDGPLSQWRKSSFICALGFEYNCCEQFMMHQKALLFDDQEIADAVMRAPRPREQKALGKQVRNFKEPIWDEYKLGIVWQGNFLRFSQNEKDRNFLISTGSKHLAEASPHDQIWGVGLSAENENVYSREHWRGQNLLGEVLMSVRSMLALQHSQLQLF